MKRRYKAKSQDLEFIDNVVREFCKLGSVSGGRLEGYNTNLFAIDLGPDMPAIWPFNPSYTEYHQQTVEPLLVAGLSVSLKSKPIKRYVIFGPVTQIEVTLNVEGENIERKIDLILEKYFRST